MEKPSHKKSFFFFFLSSPYSRREKMTLIKGLDAFAPFFFTVVFVYNVYLFYIVQQDNFFYKLGIMKMGIYTFVYIAFIAPIFEEFIFRYNLSEKKYNYVVSALFACGYVIFRTQLFEKSLLAVDYFIIGFSVLLLVLSFFKINRLLFFYLSNVLFSALHIFNYEIQFEYLLFYIVSFLMYLIVGFFFSFCRIYFNFFTAVLCHILFNIVNAVVLLVKTGFYA